MKLFVRNLPYSLKDDELREIFEKAGEVKSAKVIMDRMTGKSRGFGFVEMADADSGQKAIDEVNGTEINGRALVVDVARDNQRR